MAHHEPSPVCKSVLAHVKDYPRAVSHGTLVVMAKKRKDPHAVALGRKGGKKGGKARWEGVSPEERSAIARKAAQARWGSRKRTRREDTPG